MALETHFASALASTAGANKRHLCLFNAAGSGKVIKLFSVFAANAPTAVVTGLVIPLYVARITTAPTGGGAVTINKADTLNANLPAQITAMSNATSGATEEASAFGCGAVSGEEASQGTNAPLYAALPIGSQIITLREGQGLVVKQGALASAGAINVVVAFGVQ